MIIEFVKPRMLHKNKDSGEIQSAYESHDFTTFDITLVTVMLLLGLLDLMLYF